MDGGGESNGGDDTGGRGDGDAVVETVEHEGPARVPLAQDAAYRLSRAVLVRNEEWAQETQRAIDEDGGAAPPAHLGQRGHIGYSDSFQQLICRL